MLEGDVREVRWQAENHKFVPLGNQEEGRTVRKKADAGRTGKQLFSSPDTQGKGSLESASDRISCGILRFLEQQRRLQVSRQAISRIVYSMGSSNRPSRFADVPPGHGVLAFPEFLIRRDGVVFRARRCDRVHPVNCMEGCYTLVGGWMGKAANNHGTSVSVLRPRHREYSFGIHWESNSVCGHNPATDCIVEAVQLEIEGLLIAEMVSI